MANNVEAGPIDVHSHIAVPECADLVGDTFAYWMDPFTAYSAPATNEYNREQFASVAEQLTSPEKRLADMDRMGIAVQALAIAPPQYYYWTDPVLGEDLAQRQNHRIAELVQSYPHRFVGLATVPLQDVSRATAELRRCVTELGFAGVEICTQVNGMDLDNRRYDDFYACVEESGACLLLHPHGFTHAQRLYEYYLNNVIGNPLESTIALSRMIFGGVLERFPGLKLCVVHGGGYLPLYWSRAEHAYHHRPECREHISAPPSEYLRRVYVDCLVYDSTHLSLLLEQKGSDRVVIGTDYPYDMGSYDPLGQIAAVPGLPDEGRAAVEEGNARTLLGLS